MNAVAEQHNYYTPPKYQVKQLEKEYALRLEDRLEHFVEWLMENDVALLSGRIDDLLTTEEMHELIMEYVNS